MTRAALALLAASCAPASTMMDLGVPDLAPAAVEDRADPEIAALVAGVDAGRISATEQTLAGFTTRNTCSTSIADARDWIRGQFAAIDGLQVALDPFTYNGCGAPVTRENVVAWLPGAHPERLIVVGGHYDSRTIDVVDGVSPAPGANDSGSQTAVVLEAARALAGHGFDATVVFVAFAGEEQGLIGSKSFAAGYATYFPGASVEAMLNCDIVGGDSTANDAAALQTFRLYSPGTPREIQSADGTSDDTSPSRGLMRFVGEWGARYAPSLMMTPKLREDRPGRGGDHEAFIARAVPAVRFIDPAENLAHQHTGDDRVDYLTPAYTAKLAQVVAATAAALARAPSAPRDFSASGGAAITLGWSGTADHFVVAERPASENLYRARRRFDGTQGAVTVDDLGVAGAPFYLSVAAVDAAGHQSLFAYPEVRCDGTSCAVPPDALAVTATQ